MSTQPPSSDQAVPSHLQGAVNLVVSAVVNKYGSPAPIVGVEGIIDAMRPSIELMYPDTVDDVVYKQIGAEVLGRIQVEIAKPILLAPDFEPWFKDAVTTGRVRLERWYSYKQFLTVAKGFAPQVLDSLDSASSEIVDLLGDPGQAGSYRRRGLVIGDVQSGKTATYIGVVNKAADAGYKLVVLLTGATESLRQQTQYRIDEGFLGKDSSVTNHDKVIGVGNHPTTTNFLRGQGITTHAKDFVTDSFIGQAVKIDPNADHPYLFVLKKNVTPLDNLIRWLRGQFSGDQFDIPMLLVDDESDYASVNNNYGKGDKDPSRINAKIRELLGMATRSSYMAFTATPFANVFIDHTTDDDALKDDLFPHHYIYALSSPSNYFGARRYFGTADERAEDALVDITDAHEVFPPRHKSWLQVDILPDSLEDAIRAFVVASAIRILRGDRGPRSMLINVTRFMKVQDQVFDLVSAEFGRIKTAIEIHATPPTTGPDGHPVLIALARTYANHFAGTGTTWEAVRDKLLAAVVDTTVELINSKRDKTSDDKPRNMIAVGGDVLSRGLTIEGLTISYFYRTVGAADTLLQMARWFGYRPGYEDVVRVWITPETADQFRFVHEISEELRTQIREMRELGKTPKDFGLMIRKHPESLAITAKKGASETRRMVISLAGRRIETIKIPASKAVLSGNQRAVQDFLAQLDKDSVGTWDQREHGMRYLGKLGVPRDRIADLLQAFRYDRGNLILANALHQLIRNQPAPAFQNWTVGIVGGEGDEIELAPGVILPHAPTRQVRFSADGGAGSFRVSGSRARLAGSTDLANTFNSSSDNRVEPGVYADLPHPTLLIYPLQPNWTVKPAADTDEARAAAKEETTRAAEAWERAGQGPDDLLMALKVTIPGATGSQEGDVEYLLNGPAIEEFVRDYGTDESDQEDLDA